MWSGDTADSNRALQLLFIIDIIKFWGEYTYKPAIASCLRLLAQEENIIASGELLWEDHIALDEKTSFFKKVGYSRPEPRQRAASTPPSNLSGGQRPSAPPTFNSDHTLASSGHTRAQQRDINFLHSGKDVPAAKALSYTWLLNRDPGSGDLLVVRIQKIGLQPRKLTPIVFLDETSSELGENSTSGPEPFPEVQGVKSYPRKALWSEVKKLRLEATQLCMILPLDPATYRKSNRLRDTTNIFGSFETFLNISTVLEEIVLKFTQFAARSDSQRSNVVERVQQAWKLHATPKSEDVLRELQEIARKFDIVDSVGYEMTKDGIQFQGQPPPVWMVPSKGPKNRLMVARICQKTPVLERNGLTLEHSIELSDSDDDVDISPITVSPSILEAGRRLVIGRNK